MAEHIYECRIVWTGNTGQGTASYRGYNRTWEVRTPDKPPISCSNDPLLGGDPTLHNPEDLLISALASCHMLWFLHLASGAGVVVTGYADTPEATGELSPDGAGRFVRARLRPHIALAPGSHEALADSLHGRIHDTCFIARSVNFPVTCAATYETSSG